MPKRLKKLAVFDIDGTIFRSSLLIELVREMTEEGIFPKSIQRIYSEEYYRWLDRRGSYTDYINKVVKAYERNIKGVRLEDMLAIAERLMLFHRNRVYRYTRDLVRKLRKNHFMLAISHSPYAAVEPFCREWGFDKIYALLYEVDSNGYLTGKVEHEDLIMDKGKVLERALSKEDITMKGSVGVGDSESDISFLKKVEKPVAFNPNLELYRVAKRNHWSIVVERKNVIYNIK